MAQKTPPSEDFERRLFEFSIGDLRLQDTILEKAGQRKAAGLLRDLLLDWRAYPSRTVYSPAQLRRYAAALQKIATALRKAGQAAAADLAARIGREIDGWTRKP